MNYFLIAGLQRKTAIKSYRHAVQNTSAGCRLRIHVVKFARTEIFVPNIGPQCFSFWRGGGFDISIVETSDCYHKFS